jgi:hypothetical protein
MTEDEQRVLKIINRLGKEPRAKENSGWVKSGWILHALGTDNISIHPDTLIRIVRSLEQQKWIIIERRKRNRRKDEQVYARPFSCKMNSTMNKRVIRK